MSRKTTRIVLTVALALLLTINLPWPVFALAGDVDMNGAVNIIDALTIARYDAGLSVNVFDELAADTDCDTDIDIVDALQIARYDAGIIAEVCDITENMPGPATIEFVIQVHPYEGDDMWTGVTLRHTGGENILMENIELRFDAFLGGRYNPEAQGVGGKMTNLTETPLLTWIYPSCGSTCTAVFFDSEVPTVWSEGENWEFRLGVADSESYVDVTRLTITDADGTVIYRDPDIAPAT